MIKRTKELIIRKVRIVVTAGYMIKRSTEMIIIKVRTVVISGEGNMLILELELRLLLHLGGGYLGVHFYTPIIMLFWATMLYFIIKRRRG